jgi:hypothetical protein
LGSEILPVRSSVEHVDDKLLDVKQFVDVVHDATGARKQLRSRLDVIDGGGGRGWPDDKSPYPGLRALDLGEHRVFFGRNSEIKEITERLRSPTQRSARSVLTGVGPSGSGKSSLVRAGVLPRLGAQDWLTTPPTLPGTDPLASLARALAAAAKDKRIDVNTASMRKDLEHDGLTTLATDFLIAADADDQCKLLLVVDQFEELLTQAGPEKRRRFAATLEPALGGPVQVPATMRPEFLDAASKDAALSGIALPEYQVRPLRSEALRSVIEEPAAVAGFEFEDGLVATLVADTGSGGALPLLAYTLAQLTDGVRRGALLTHQQYVGIGGVSGALQRQADAALEEASSAAGVTPEQVVSDLLGLVTVDEQGQPTKRHEPLDDISSVMNEELQPFVNRRLLTTHREGAHSFVTVAHEAFLDHWPPLKREIDSKTTAIRARKKIEADADDWLASGRDKAALLPRGKLTKATEDIGTPMKKAPPPAASDQNASQAAPLRISNGLFGTQLWDIRVALKDSGRQFVEASSRADRNRRRRRAAGIFSLFVVLLLITSFALWRSVVATQAKDHAESIARQAIASRLQSEAADILSRTTPGTDDEAFYKVLAAHGLTGDTAAAGALLDAAIRRITTAKIVPTGTPVFTVALSPDRRRIASAGMDETVQFWDGDTGQPLGDPITVNTGWVHSAVFSPDGRRIAIAGSDGTVGLWDIEIRRPVGAPLTGHSSWVFSVAFSPDGHQLATAGTNGAVRLWDLETHPHTAVSLTGHSGNVYSVVFSADGQRLATAGAEGTVRVWDLKTQPPIARSLAGHTGDVNSVAFSPDGQRLASAGADGTVRLWNVMSGKELRNVPTGHSAVNDVAFSPDGQRLATAGAEGTVQLWTGDTGQPLAETLTGLHHRHTRPVLIREWSPKMDGIAGTIWASETTGSTWPPRQLVT